MKSPLIAAGALLCLAAASPLLAQENRQDEVVNFNQDVSPSTDTIKVLRSDRKSDINNYVTEVFVLRNAKAIEILPLVLDAVRAEGGTASVIETDEYVAGDEAAQALAGSGPSYLQVVAPSFQVESLRRMVQALDVKGIRSESGMRYNHIRLANRSAEEVGDILRSSVVSPVGTVTVDSVTNTVYIEDGITDSERAIVTAAFYDVPPPQVEILVQIVELEENGDSTLGLEWDAWKETLTGGYVFEYADQYSPVDTNAFTSGNAIVAIGGDGLARFLNYMADEGKAKLLTRTTLTAMNNEAATFSNMTPIPNYKYALEKVELTTLAQMRYDGELLAAGAPEGLQYLHDSQLDFFRLVERFQHSEGIAIVVEPVIGTDSVTMDVNALMNSQVDVTSQETPVVASRETSSRVNLAMGQTLKLAGFDRVSEVKDMRGIPLLKDIPYLGYLFGREVTLKRNKQVVVFLTPQARSTGAYAARRLDDRTVFTTLPAPTGGAVTTPVGTVLQASDEALRAGAAAEMEAELGEQAKDAKVSE